MSTTTLRQRVTAVERELASLREKIRREEEQIAQVVFPGNSKVYCYEAATPFAVGDYLVVHSPMTNRNEFVKIVGRGRTSFMERFSGSLKVGKVVNAAEVYSPRGGTHRVDMKVRSPEELF